MTNVFFTWIKRAITLKVGSLLHVCFSHVCPISWAIVKAVPRPMSSLMLQLLSGSHIPPTGAKPVAHTRMRLESYSIALLWFVSLAAGDLFLFRCINSFLNFQTLEIQTWVPLRLCIMYGVSLSIYSRGLRFSSGVRLCFMSVVSTVSIMHEKYKRVRVCVYVCT